MKIALITENSQAAKNAVIENALKKVVEPMGHEVVNYGMYSAEDPNSLTYVQIGILAAVLLNSGAADYVITGCGTGEGAMLACNSFPGVICGHVEDPLDAKNHCAKVVVRTEAEADEAGNKIKPDGQESLASWDSQFFIYVRQNIESGKKLKLTMRVRADKACSIETQAHWEPGNYNHYQL